MANNVTTIPGYLKPIGYEQITTLSSSVSLNPPNFADVALIQPETQNVRWRDDGTDPTAAIGMILVANDILIYTGKMAEIEFIEVAASAKLNVTYYKNNG